MNVSVTDGDGALLPYASMVPSHELVPMLCFARVLTVAFRAEVDLSHHLPAQFIARDPHLGIFRVTQMRTRFVGERPLPLLLSQSVFASLGVSATAADADDGVERDFHFVTWHSRAWALGRGMSPGNRVRHAEIEATWTFPAGPVFDRGNDTGRFAVDVDRLGGRAAEFRGNLGSSTLLAGAALPSIVGRYSLERGSLGPTGAASEPVVVAETYGSVAEGPATFGTGTLVLRALPDDQPPERALLGDLGTVDVTFCSLRDATWIREMPREWNGAEEWPR